MPDENFADLMAERVVLRRFRLDDLDAFLAYRSSPQVARFQGWGRALPGRGGQAAHPADDDGPA